MTSYFHIGELPGEVPQIDHDLARWDTLYETAELVYRRCIEGQDIAGWELVGKWGRLNFIRNG